MKRILLANPRGYCAGVARAVDVVERLLDMHGPPLYVRKEIVHNRRVVERLRSRGAIFVDEVDEVPDDGMLVFSAHGIAPAVRRAAEERGLRAVDATCPLVTKVHNEAVAFARAGLHVLLVGHAEHDEVVGTLGHVPDRCTIVENEAQAETVHVEDPLHVAVVTQTTLSVDETRGIVEILRRRFPAMAAAPRSDICYATQNRQDAVKDLAARADVIIVVGSANSSNSVRLAECARAAGTPAVLCDDPAALDLSCLEGASTVGVTAGASSPDDLVSAIVERIRSLDDWHIEEVGTPEPDIVFSMPKPLR